MAVRADESCFVTAVVGYHREVWNLSRGAEVDNVLCHHFRLRRQLSELFTSALSFERLLIVVSK